MTKIDEEKAKAEVLDLLGTLREEIGEMWPLSEAFTDLDDHPEQEESGGFNYIVGRVSGLCDAFGWDVLSLCAVVEPNPPEEEDEDAE